MPDKLLTIIKKLVGTFVFIMTLLSIAASIFTSISPLFTAVFAWTAALIMIRQLPRAMLIQVSVMLLTGIGCLLWNIDGLSQHTLIKSLSANHKLLALLAAISFLRLLTQTDTLEQAPLPRGKTAFIKTLWGYHLFCSVITLSAMMIFGNRIEKEATINRLHGILFSRGFAAACFWSPFYVAIAMALLYSPGSELLVLSLAGMPVALAALLLSSWQLINDKEIESTAGFPVHLNSLTIPLTLSVLVVLSHLLLPDFPVLTLITILSLFLTFIILIYQKPLQALSVITEHINNALPGVHRELSLFLAAGVMSTGITLLISNNELSLSISEFSPMTGGLFILVSILVSIFGVHPIITISVVGSLLSNTEFNPNLLGLCMMMMWGLGIVISPLSGINLAIQGRFNLSSFSMMRWNAGYVVSLFIFCVALLTVYSYTKLL